MFGKGSGSAEGLAALKTCYSTSNTPPLVGNDDGLLLYHRDSIFSSTSGLEEETEDR